MKKCITCGCVKPDSGFHKYKRSKDGLKSHCKDCASAYGQSYKEKIAERDEAYHQANKKKIAARGKAYYQANKEKCDARRKLYFQKNKEKIAASRKAHYQANKEKLAEYAKAYRQNSKEKIAASGRAWKAVNKNKVRSQCQRRRALLKGAESDKFIDIEIFDRDGWQCGLCGKKVNKRLKWPNPMSKSLDHIIPLIKGGNHTKNNVQCSHLVCNLSKNSSTTGQLLLQMFNESN